MFNNIGRKIKMLATIITIVGIAASLIGGIALCTQRYFEAIGIIVIIFGSFFSWLGSFFMYGFGQLIESTQNIEKSFSTNHSNNKYKNNIPNAPDPKVLTDNSWYCSKCGAKNNVNVSTCVVCGTTVQVKVKRQPTENEWKSPKCGKINQNYVGTCGCGTKKPN